MHLRYDMYGAYKSGVLEHPQKVMKDLGISYEYALPQSIADQWWFFNAYGSTDNLPTFINLLEVKASSCIGNGLSPELAEQISKGE